MNPAKGTAKLSGAGVTVSTNGVPSCTTARVIIDEGGGTTYCALLTEGKMIPWTQFNTECWSGAGKPLSAAPTAEAIEVQFVTTKAQACPFTNFCITGITL
jgi:hypothetical protein